MEEDDELDAIEGKGQEVDRRQKDQRTKAGITQGYLEVTMPWYLIPKDLLNLQYLFRSRNRQKLQYYLDLTTHYKHTQLYLLTILISFDIPSQIEHFVEYS